MPTLHNIWFVSDARQDWKRYFLLLIVPTLVHSYFFNGGFSIYLLVVIPLLYLSWITASLGLTTIVWASQATNWYLKCLKQYADFNGRARRKEYWMFFLLNSVFAVVAMILDNVLGIVIEGVGYGPLYGLYALAVLIPGLAVSVRRLHDVGKSGWMLLITLIPLVGAIWLLVLMLTDSDSRENQYGANPKEIYNGEFTSSESSGISNNYKILPKLSMLTSAILFVVYMISSAPLGKSNSSVATYDLPEPKTIKTTVGEKESFSKEREKSPVYEESINGVYSYTEPNFEAQITISESSWSGRTTIYGSTEYQRGIMNGSDLYDDSGFVKIGYVSNGRIVTSLGGQSVSLAKN